MKKLVILGGGYGGMRIIDTLLPNRLPKDVEIILIDRNPYHSLKTEYYALAAGTISDQHIRVGFPEHPQLTYVCGNVRGISLENNSVRLEDGREIQYDDLVIGLGCTDKYHNVPGAQENTYSIQTIEKSRRTYQALNNLGIGATVSIVGAGLSGVELASELIESRPDLKIKLFDRSKLILSSFSPRLSNYVADWFKKHNVEIISESNITKVEPNLLYNHDEPVESDVIVWTAGIQPVKLVRDLPVEKDPQLRIKLTPQHFIPNFENVFVVGDCASLNHAPSAQLAQAQAEQIAVVLEKKWKGEPLPESFPPMKGKGMLGSLGKKQGFGLVGDTPIKGRVARLLKSGILWMHKFHTG
ncbi:NAD(P)/FAD-dependent oxidoreductase [Bacillus sp. AGMB 02131]|uniref:NAD(P)/FAD-dependent oxidoreductase n=1 Tax=Peribacillus faecalis TaxID=2772559 RepID=A0A927HBZ8_9BACI|nr:NAD(P)/FAD-dependent oxidoreductase [Peribacillus faecalis]MBD3109041.1 NAD(P)/FAD-dependent oxidoreductase [Peribacillus faecalis]